MLFLGFYYNFYVKYFLEAFFGAPSPATTNTTAKKKTILYFTTLASQFLH